MIAILLFIPLAAAFATLFIRQRRNIGAVNIFARGATTLVSFLILMDVYRNGPLFSSGKWLMADLFSAYLGIIVSFISFMALWYSLGYLSEELKKGVTEERYVRQYYIFAQLFVFTMLTAVFSDNLALMWVAIEGTTLATTFLINYYRNQLTLEAAWKYLVICTVGIGIALFGVILTYYAALKAGVPPTDVLAWSSLVSTDGLDPGLLKIAFVFVLIGYGTKAGLAPLHTWLPDAHGRAPSPISAILSGVLLNVAIYAVLRFKIITDAALQSNHFTDSLFILFGALSVVLAGLIILAARKYKRLLAYSSIEHIGLISLGIGFGTPLSVLGALWHMLNHALTKSMLFFSAGNVLLKYNSGRIVNVSGMIKIIPATAALFTAGVLAIVGLPPFATFFSKFMILAGGFQGGHFLVSALALAALAVAFAGFMIHLSRMLFGAAPDGIKEGEPKNRSLFWPAAINILAVLALGLMMPNGLADLLNKITEIIITN